MVFVKRFLKSFSKIFSMVFHARQHGELNPSHHVGPDATSHRPLTYILYHTFVILSRGFWKVFQKFLVVYCSARFSPRRSICANLLGLFPRLLTVYIIPHFCDFVKRFFKTFWKIFSVETMLDFASFHLCQRYRLLTTIILYHTPSQKSIVKIHKIGKNIRWKFV